VIPDPPRQLRFDALRLVLRRRPSLFFGAMFLAIPVLQYLVVTLVMVPVFQGQDEAKIRAEGRAAKGEVIRVEDVPNLSINGISPKRVFFHYQADGVERETSTITVSVAEVAKWQKGRRVDVRYLDGRATIVDVQPVDFPIPMSFIWAGQIAMLCLGGALLGFGVVRARRAYGLLKHGVVRPAKLVSCEALSLTMWSHLAPRFNATYVYADSSGHEIFGCATSADLLLLSQKKGEEVRVLVLPGDERRSTILDSAAERVLISP
jgi:hypothetical protein